MSKKQKTSNRKRVKKAPCKYNKIKIQKEMSVASKNKTGLSEKNISCFLSKASNFLGCFAQDQLSSLVIKTLPVFIIVNFDHSYSSGTHWVALKIGKNTLEIFDPLGFNSLRWPNIPHFLLHFLHRYSKHRFIEISKEIQPYNSTLCGFYCVFFVLYRSTHKFTDCNKIFSAKLYKNDKILYNVFNKI